MSQERAAHAGAPDSNARARTTLRADISRRAEPLADRLESGAPALTGGATGRLKGRGQSLLEDQAVRHSFHHLAAVRGALRI